MSEARRIKSRTGCLQCKQRKVKCDEATPSCRQCLRRKLSCPGYRKPLKWKQLRVSGTRRSSTSPQSVSVLIQAKAQPTTLPSTKGSDDLPVTEKTNLSETSSLDQFLALTDLCRTPTPRPVCSPTKQLQDPASQFVAIYFKRTCRIMSTFDSYLNPFRALVASMMVDSEPVYLLIQAMGAIQISREDPDMHFEALQLQAQSCLSIRKRIGVVVQKSSDVSDDLMLSVVLLGLTSAWFKIEDVGQSHLAGAQVLLRQWLDSSQVGPQYQKSFILGSFIYWHTISSFVSTDPRGHFEMQEAFYPLLDRFKQSGSLPEISYAHSRTIPHPLSGFSAKLVLHLGEAGSLCRIIHQGRKSGAPRAYLLEYILKAKALALTLLQLEVSVPNTLNDLFDRRTAVGDIQRLGEAYRCAALLQLFTYIPELIGTCHYECWPSMRSGGHAENELKLACSETRFSGGLVYGVRDRKVLESLALYALQILHATPETSGTSTLQGIVLVIAAPWAPSLKYPDVGTTGGIAGAGLPYSHPWGTYLPEPGPPKSAAYWRNFVSDRLDNIDKYVGLIPVLRIIQIVKEIFRLQDDGLQCDWLSVMAQNGWETLLG